MSKEKQVEKMTKTMRGFKCEGDCSSCRKCDEWRCAERLYDEDYRKQSKDTVEVVRCKDCEYHHWEQEPCHGKTVHKCSVLNAEVFKDFYCYYGKPKMKGGAE